MHFGDRSAACAMFNMPFEQSKLCAKEAGEHSALLRVKQFALWHVARTVFFFFLHMQVFRLSTAAFYRAAHLFSRYFLDVSTCLSPLFIYYRNK